MLPSLSAFFPAFNEESNLRRMYESLTAALPLVAAEHEILVVDDGSRDRTGEICEELALADPRVRHIRHVTNLGYGAAVADGLAASRHEYVFFTDGDCQFDISQLSLLVPFAARYDAVIGYRVDRRDNLVRRMNAWAWNLLVDRMFGLRVRDVNCAFKLFRKSALPASPLESTGAMINTELLVRMVRAGRSVREVGVRHRPRTAGRQTGANLRVISRAFRELGSFRRRVRQEGS